MHCMTYYYEIDRETPFQFSSKTKSPCRKCAHFLMQFGIPWWEKNGTETTTTTTTTTTTATQWLRTGKTHCLFTRCFFLPLPFLRLRTKTPTNTRVSLTFYVFSGMEFHMWCEPFDHRIGWIAVCKQTSQFMWGKSNHKTKQSRIERNAQKNMVFFLFRFVKDAIVGFARKRKILNK